MLHVSFPSVARAHVFWVQMQGQMLSEVLQGRGYSQVSDVPSGEEDAKGGPQVAEAEAEAGWQCCARFIILIRIILIILVPSSNLAIYQLSTNAS